MSDRFDLITLIGRFQIFHLGHREQVMRALERAERLLIQVGSTNRIRSQRNPFTYAERREMILSVLAELGPDAQARTVIEPLPDRVYDFNAWIEQVQMRVKLLMADYPAPRIALAGNDKDTTTYYLKHFPEWTRAGITAQHAINATALRERYLTPACDLTAYFPHVVPPSVIEFLSRFRDHKAYGDLMADRQAILKSQAEYGKGPFMAGDAIVIQAGAVLMITRGARPNLGAKAVPGGFLEPYETLYDCAVRELFEETGIDQNFDSVDEARAFFAAHHRGSYLFDDPHRSDRSRIVSQAQVFHLPATLGGRLQVVGKDDAASAYWAPFSDIRNEDCFDDHGFMIEKAVHLLR